MNNINAKVGQKWRCRNGNIATVVKSDGPDNCGYGFHTTGSGYKERGKEVAMIHYVDGTANIRQPEFDLISLVDEKEDKIYQAERNLAELRAKAQAVEKALAELRKPDPIRHGDYGRARDGSPRVFYRYNSAVAAFDADSDLMHFDANEAQRDFSMYKILGNIFDDMAKKAQA